MNIIIIIIAIIKDGYQPDGHVKLDRKNPPRGN